MERITKKLETMQDALDTLADSIELFEKYTRLFEETPSEEQEKLFLAMRDSMIQRFEYCVDLFWKLLKAYLEFEKLPDIPAAPRLVIREAVTTKIISEGEGDECMNMIKSRNQTSHIYHEAIAQTIAREVPKYFEMLQAIVDRIREMVQSK